jgi:ubiquinone/menaquinone biosynthesis C-methylase UbiE
MGRRVNLLRSLPVSKRNLQARKDGKSADVIRISSEFGEMYFDGPREYGYGGYRYDGRWIPVARDIVAHFGLRAGQRVLDVGCAKGFLVKDLLSVCPGLEVFGIDVSTYALHQCEPEVIGRLHRGSADDLPFPDNSFDAVLSINTIHNLDRDGCVRALKEMQRLAPGCGYVRVDSYATPEQRALFEDWVLTARFHDYPDGWLSVFEEAGYTGDYDWTVLE